MKRVLGVLLCLLSSASVARAEAPLPPEPVTLRVRALLRECSGVQEAEVQRVLSAELASDPAPGGAAPTWVVRCEGKRVTIAVSDPLSRKVVQRSFELDAASPRARGRLLGIASAELVLASWAELSVQPKLRVVPEGAEPDAAVVAQAVERARAEPAEVSRARPTLLLGTDPELARESRGPDGARVLHHDYESERLPSRTALRGTVFGSLRTFTNRRGVFKGGGVRFGKDLLPLHAWAIDAAAESGTLHFPGGNRVQVDSWTLGAMLYFVGDGRLLTWRAGVGLRGGLATSDAPPRSQRAAWRRSALALWGWPLGTLSSTLRLGERVVVDLNGEFGYAAVPISPGFGGASVRGPWLCLQFGAGFAL